MRWNEMTNFAHVFRTKRAAIFLVFKLLYISETSIYIIYMILNNNNYVESIKNILSNEADFDNLVESVSFIKFENAAYAIFSSQIDRAAFVRICCVLSHCRICIVLSHCRICCILSHRRICRVWGEIATVRDVVYQPPSSSRYRSINISY